MASTTAASSGLASRLHVSNESLTLGLVVSQIVLLTGSLVGGHLARKRRLELETLTLKLREVVHELRKRQEEEQQALVCEADPDEGVSAYQHALEASMASPLAAHPIEGYGMDNSSVADARRKVSKLLYGAKTAYEEGRPEASVNSCQEALGLAHELLDKRALRAILRVQARAHRSLRQYHEAVRCLTDALDLSKELGERYGDVDTLGLLADLHVEMGDIEKASVIYDEVIEAIQQEDVAGVAASSSWDC